MISFADVGKVESDVIDWWRSEDNDVDSRSSTPIALPVDEIHRYFLRNAINVSSVQAKNPPREGKLQLLSLVMICQGKILVSIFQPRFSLRTTKYKGTYSDITFAQRQNLR